MVRVDELYDMTEEGKGESEESVEKRARLPIEYARFSILSVWWSRMLFFSFSSWCVWYEVFDSLCACKPPGGGYTT